MSERVSLVAHEENDTMIKISDDDNNNNNQNNNNQNNSNLTHNSHLSDSTSRLNDEELPSYEAVTGNTPPPAYSSLFGRIRDERERSKSAGIFFIRLFIILLSTIGFSIFLALSLGLPLSMIIMGAKYWDAPCDTDNFKLYLVIGGTFGLVSMLHALCTSKKKREIDPVTGEVTETESNNGSGFIKLIDLFLFIWFIIGNTWVYGYDPGDNYEKCDKTLFLFTFWIITSIYMIIGFFLFLFCFGVVCCGCFGSSSSSSSSSSSTSSSSNPNANSSDSDSEAEAEAGTSISLNPNTPSYTGPTLSSPAV